MSKLIVLFLSAIILFSCAESNKPQDGGSFQSDKFSNNVILEGWNNPECKKDFDNSILGDLYVTHWRSRDGVENFLYPFSTYTNSNPFRSGIIKGLYQGPQYFKNKNGKLIKAQQPLSFCGEDNFYKRYSIESQALAVLSSINESYNFISGTGSGIKIDPIRLYVQTIRKFKLGKTTAYVANNAYYSPRNKAIYFYPMSKKKKGTHGLWEIPFVAVHEFGHHILSEVFSSSREFSKFTLKEKQEMKFREQVTGKTDKAYYSTVEAAIDILHEGFSDLFAFLSLGDSFLELSFDDCLSINRSPLISFFNVLEAGTSLVHKKFKSEYISSYFKKSSPIVYKTKSCRVDFANDEHSLGAILAYTMNSTMNVLDLSKEEKFKQLILWANRLEADFPKSKQLSSEEFLKNSVILFIDQISELLPIESTRMNGKTALIENKSFCTQLINNFPAIVNREGSECRYTKYK
jgi:hypothetical protein